MERSTALLTAELHSSAVRVPASSTHRRCVECSGPPLTAGLHGSPVPVLLQRSDDAARQGIGFTSPTLADSIVSPIVQLSKCQLVGVGSHGESIRSCPRSRARRGVEPDGVMQDMARPAGTARRCPGRPFRALTADRGEWTGSLLLSDAG